MVTVGGRSDGRSGGTTGRGEGGGNDTDIDKNPGETDDNCESVKSLAAKKAEELKLDELLRKCPFALGKSLDEACRLGKLYSSVSPTARPSVRPLSRKGGSYSGLNS